MCQNINLWKLILTYISVWSGFQVDIEICPGKLDQSGDRILFSNITKDFIQYKITQPYINDNIDKASQVEDRQPTLWQDSTVAII